MSRGTVLVGHTTWRVGTGRVGVLVFSLSCTLDRSQGLNPVSPRPYTSSGPPKIDRGLDQRRRGGVRRGGNGEIRGRELGPVRKVYV